MCEWAIRPACGTISTCNRQIDVRSSLPAGLQILGYINPWLTLRGPGATCTVAREVLDVFMGLLVMSNRISQANRCVSGLWSCCTMVGVELN